MKINVLTLRVKETKELLTAVGFDTNSDSVCISCEIKLSLITSKELEKLEESFEINEIDEDTISIYTEEDVYHLTEDFLDILEFSEEQVDIV